MSGPDELKFRWEDPVPGERGSHDPISGHPCVRVGRILRDQVVVRIFRDLSKKDDLFDAVRGNKFELVLVFDGGATRHVAQFNYLNIAQEVGEMVLFGALRDWIACSSCGCLSSSAGKNELRARRLCSLCKFWLERVTQIAAEPHRHAVVKGTFYSVGEEGQSGSRDGRGFGGQRFEIRWRDGRQLVTTNLWHRGEVPGHFRDRLPDDADFA